MFSFDIFRFLIDKPEVANAAAAIASSALAVIAVVLSLVSLYVAYAALKHQRGHNRLSVRPLAYIMLGDYQNQLFVKIINNGTGPMIVQAVVVDGAKEPMRPLVEAMPALLPKVMWTSFVEDCSNRSVPAGGELVLIDLSAASSSSNGQFELSRDKVRFALGKLAISVSYTDIYHSKLPIATRNLKFFHRLLSPEQLAEA